jgi:hypothetical protein
MSICLVIRLIIILETINDYGLLNLERQRHYFGFFFRLTTPYSLIGRGYYKVRMGTSKSMDAADLNKYRIEAVFNSVHPAGLKNKDFNH